MISYPEPRFKVRREGGKDQVFDPLRKTWVTATPEEWVRLNFVQYLVQVKKYPSTLIAIEKEINLGELKKRFDILVYDSQHRPWMMIECKAMNVPVSENVLHQVLRYNISIPVPYLILTNGNYCMAASRKNNEFSLLSELPEYE